MYDYQHSFSRRHYGRIFTDKEENIEKIKSIIKEMDEFEYSYLPDNFIGVFKTNYFGDENQYYCVETIYTHKFDGLDTNELTRRCWEQGIMMFCWFGRGGEYENA